MCTNRDPTLRQYELVHKAAPLSNKGMPLEQVVQSFAPTVLLGLAGAEGGLFNESVVRAASAQTFMPCILAMSNPTSRAECTAEQAATLQRYHECCMT